jgi:hypothetical protein
VTHARSAAGIVLTGRVCDEEAALRESSPHGGVPHAKKLQARLQLLRMQQGRYLSPSARPLPLVASGLTGRDCKSVASPAQPQDDA